MFLTEQVRATDPEQRARVVTLRSGVITKELIAGIPRLTPADARGAFRDATFMVRTNAERVLINSIRAAEFAMRNGVPIVQWRNPIEPGLLHALGDELLSDLLGMENELVTCFVQGAPAMVLANVNPQCGLANGSSCRFVGLGVSDEDRDRQRQARRDCGSIRRPMCSSL
jgi:hypothetical protein